MGPWELLFGGPAMLLRFCNWDVEVRGWGSAMESPALGVFDDAMRLPLLHVCSRLGNKNEERQWRDERGRQQEQEQAVD